MASLFVYGTLMSAEIFQAVTGVAPVTRKATLKGFRRFEVKNADYPGIIARKDAEVEGLICKAIPEAIWTRLDKFEGEMYQREKVVVHLDGGETLDVFVYVVRAEYADMLGSQEWDYDNFIKSGKNNFVSQYAGFHDLD